jgi:DinB family protein
MDVSDLPRVGLTEAIERLATMPAFVEAALDAASGGELAFRPGEEEFSLREHACHLRDVEREGYLLRVQRILAEGTPALEGFDGAAVARERDYSSQDARAAARDFAQARRSVIALLAAANAEQLKRPATFGGRRITLEDLAGMMLEHDRGHREEIENIVDAFSGD